MANWKHRHVAKKLGKKAPKNEKRWGSVHTASDPVLWRSTEKLEGSKSYLRSPRNCENEKNDSFN